MNILLIRIADVLLITGIILLFGVKVQAKAVSAAAAVPAGEISKQTNSKLWQIYGNKTPDTKLQEKYIPINSTYLVYPAPHKNTDITSLKLKNKSLSVSIPIQHKKSAADITEDKRVIKTSEYKNY